MREPSRLWYGARLPLHFWWLLPLAGLFRLIVAFRKCLYRYGVLRQHDVGVPVVVIGNIVVGGTGKTPLVMWLANYLLAHGRKPGIVSRGYQGSAIHPMQVKSDSDPRIVGDEAILLARHTSCPVIVARDRVAAARELLRQANCDVVLTDDGIQHYRLARSVEIAVVDGVRRFGNGHLLPAGPLREPISRLSQVDFVVVRDGGPRDAWVMHMRPTEFVQMQTHQHVSTHHFQGRQVHAVAAIGHPEQFFKQLRDLGMHVIPHAFPDHYAYSREDLNFADDCPIIMTEKDAAKCERFANERWWYMAVKLDVSEELGTQILLKINAVEVRDAKKINDTLEHGRPISSAQSAKLRG